MTTQPRTAAGRALSRAWRVRRTASPGLEEAWPDQFDRYILAIEAEAAAPALDVIALASFFHEEYWAESNEKHWPREQADATDCAICWRSASKLYARLSADEEGGT